MRKLVEDIRTMLAQGPVDRSAIVRLEKLVAAAVPRLQETSLCTEPLKAGRYLCYRDPDFGFVVMLLVWGKGDATAIHDHGTWGVEAVLKSTLKVVNYCSSESAPQPTSSKVIDAGCVMHNLPPDRDVHKVEHAADDGETAVSLHIYGREMTNNRQFIPGEGFKTCALGCRDMCHELSRKFGLESMPRASSL